MTQAKTPVPSEKATSQKDRRAQALQKALRENLRRRKAASAGVDEVPASESEAPDGGDGKKV